MLLFLCFLWPKFQTFLIEVLPAHLVFISVLYVILPSHLLLGTSIPLTLFTHTFIIFGKITLTLISCNLVSGIGGTEIRAVFFFVSSLHSYSSFRACWRGKKTLRCAGRELRRLYLLTNLDTTQIGFAGIPTIHRLSLLSPLHDALPSLYCIVNHHCLLLLSSCPPLRFFSLPLWDSHKQGTYIAVTAHFFTHG